MLEKDLLSNEALPLHSVLDCMEVGVCLLDEAGRVVFVNSAAVKLMGFDETELKGRPFPACVDGEQTVGGNGSRWRRVSLAKRTGRKMEFMVAAKKLKVGDCTRTVLELRRREEARKPPSKTSSAEEKLYDVFDTIPDGLILIDEAGTVQLFNSGAEKLFGYQREEMLGKNVKILMPSQDRQAHDHYLATYMRTGVKKIIGVGREVIARHKSGSVLPIHLSIGELKLEDRRLFVGVMHDLTDRKRVQQQLLTLSAAMDQSPIAVLIAGKDGVIEYVNRSFTRLAGYEVEELVGQNPSLLSSKHTGRDQYQRLWRTILSGAEWRGEVENRKKDGSLYWALETITPLRDAEGEITHYLAIQQDVTAQKHDREALVESEARFRQVAELTGEWLWEQDPQGRYTYSSGAVLQILGYTPQEILGRNYLDLQVKIEASQSLGASRASSSKNKAFFRLVNQYLHKEGGIVFTESSGAPIFDDKGNVALWRGVDHDVTAHKAFEDALRLRDRAMESVRVGVAISDARAPGNPNIYVNPALSRITGYSREELLGHSLRMLRGPETSLVGLEQIREAVSRGHDCEVTLKNYRKGGAAFWNEVLISPVADETGEIKHYIGIHTDVTERRRAAESRHELEIAKHIQLSLLPEAPMRLPQVEFAGLCVPASHVGGDYFDFFENSEAVDAVIADVSGHSVGAALMMTELRSALRVETRKAATAKTSPAEILRELNELLYEDLNKTESFITLFYLKFLPNERILKYGNAGHNRAILLRSEGSECAALDADGLVLGVMRNVQFEEKSIELAAGDALLLYTDGVTDARNARGDYFGLDRLCAAFRAHRALSPEQRVRRLLADVRSFCGDEPLDDDIAIVMMQVR